MADPWSDRIPAQLTDREEHALRQQSDVIARIVQEMRDRIVEVAGSHSEHMTGLDVDRLSRWADALASSGAPPQKEVVELQPPTSEE